MIALMVPGMIALMRPVFGSLRGLEEAVLSYFILGDLFKCLSVRALTFWSAVAFTFECQSVGPMAKTIQSRRAK